MSDIQVEARDIGRTLFERALQRRIKGLEYIPSPHPPEGPSARDLLISNGTLNLYHYRPDHDRPGADQAHAVPILLVMSTGNRGYVADLARGNSIVEQMLKAGFDLFMIEWSPPDVDEKYLKFENYILDFLPRCVARVRKVTGAPGLTVIGYRMGGLFALLWAALNPDKGLRNLVCVSTPFDYSKLGIYQAWSDRRFFDVDKLVDRCGCCPTDMLDGLFELQGRQGPEHRALGLWNGLWSDDERQSVNMFMRWMGDILPQPGEYFRQMIKRLMRENRLVHGSFEVGGRPIDPGLIQASFLQIVADDDNLIAPAASRPLIAAIGSRDKHEIVSAGGHASLFLGNAGDRLWKPVIAWLTERSA